jgi:hypothetical protein
VLPLFRDPLTAEPGEEQANSNVRAGISGTFTTGGHTYSFAGSWPYCA